jgi:hypothetical protein
MARYAIVGSTGQVVNIIELDPLHGSWSPPDGTQLVLDNIGVDQSWTYANGTFIPPPLPPAQSSVPARPTPREWLERLSPATQAAITTAAMSSPALMLWLFKAAGTPAIDVTAAETQAGVAAMIAAGVITPADQATLLAL